MAKNKRWSKVIARIQALEDALAGLLTAKPRKTRKPAKAKIKAAKPAKARRATAKRGKAAAKPAKAASRKSRPAAKTTKRARRKTARQIAAENMPIMPGMPVGSL
jgi:hypothetical protein